MNKKNWNFYFKIYDESDVEVAKLEIDVEKACCREIITTCTTQSDWKHLISNSFKTINFYKKFSLILFFNVFIEISYDF